MADSECADVSHMLVIQLIWQEVFKSCQSQCVQDHSVMVTPYLSVTILAISAITVAHGGIYSFSNWFYNIFCSVLHVQRLWPLFCRYQYNLSERFSECHMEHHRRSGTIRKPSLPRKLCAVQASNPAYWRGGGPIQLPVDQLQICKTGNENAEREPFNHYQHLIHPFFCRWRENTSYLKIKWCTGHMRSLNRPSTSIPFTVFIEGRVKFLQCLMNQQPKWNLRKFFLGTSDLMCGVPRSWTPDQGFRRAEAGWSSPWVYLMVQRYRGVKLQVYTEVCVLEVFCYYL